MSNTKITREYVAAAIRIVREREGWSTEQYAKKAKITTYYLGHLQDFKHNVGIDIVERLANVVDMSVSEFIKMGEGE